MAKYIQIKYKTFKSIIGKKKKKKRAVDKIKTKNKTFFK